MKVFIVGANGGIGRILSNQLANEDRITPIAMIRKEEQRSYFKDIGVETRLGDLEDSTESLSDLMSGSDALVFTAGSGGNTGYDKTLVIDLDAAVKCMEAAESCGIDRFLMVSAMKADDRSAWDSSPIKPYMIAKHYADRILKQSSLDHTILRPGRLTDSKGTGSITTDPSGASGGDIPREDVASVLKECLRTDHSSQKVFEFVSGDTDISLAVGSL